MAEKEKAISGYASWKEKFPDFALVVDGKELACHKSFLSKNSPVLDRMLNIDCKESNTNKMEIMNFDVKTVTGFLEFIYAETTGPDNLAVVKEASIDPNAHIYKRNIDKKTLTPELLEMSHMYEVKDLESDCIDYLKDHVLRRNIAKIWSVADKCQSKILKKSAFKYLAENSKAMSAPGIEEFLSPQVKELLEYIHARMTSATTTQDVVWVEDDEKISWMKEVYIGFIYYLHPLSKTSGEFQGPGATQNNAMILLANSYDPQVKGIFPSSLITDSLTEWFDEQQKLLLYTTFAAIKEKDPRQATLIVICDMPSTIEEYIKVTQKLAKPGSYIVTFFNNGNRAVAKDLAKHLRQCNQQVPHWLMNMED